MRDERDERDERDPTNEVDDSNDMHRYDLASDASRHDTGMVEDESQMRENSDDTSEDEEEGKSKGKAVKIGLGVGIAAIVAGGAYLFLSGGGDNDKPIAPKPIQPKHSQHEVSNTNVEKSGDQVKTVKTDDGIKKDNNSDVINIKKPSVVPDNSGNVFKNIDQGKSPVAPAPIAPTVSAPVVNSNSVPAPVAPAPTAPVDHDSMPVEKEPTSIAPSGNSIVAPAPTEEHANITDPAVPATPVINGDHSQVPSVAPVAPVDHKATPVQPAPVAPVQSAEHNDGLINVDSGDKGMIDPDDSSNDQSLNGLISKMSALSDKVNTLNGKMMIDKSDFDNLVQRVNNLEQLVEKKSMVSPCDIKESKDVKKAVISAPHTTEKAHSHLRRVKPRDSIVVVRKEGDIAYHPTRHEAPHPRKHEFSGRLKLESIVGQRVWVRSGNGMIDSYTVGDRLPNGKTIGNVDVGSGVYDENGNLILSR